MNIPSAGNINFNNFEGFE